MCITKKVEVMRHCKGSASTCLDHKQHQGKPNSDVQSKTRVKIRRIPTCTAFLYKV